MWKCFKFWKDAEPTSSEKMPLHLNEALIEGFVRLNELEGNRNETAHLMAPLSRIFSRLSRRQYF
jgi:hypothetical protein